MEKMYYAEPLLRQDSPDIPHLASLPCGFTRDMPGARLAMALDYYIIEAYARKSDRDAACGVTAHPDIKYVPMAPSRVNKADEIACGHAFDHPDFETVLDPIFSRSVKRLISNMVAAGQKEEGPIAMEILSIARTQYKIEAIAERDIIRFEVSWQAPFEKTNRTTIKRTCAFLEDRLHLHFLPTPPKRRAH